MMVSAIPTASGYEERIRFSELEVVERGANEQGLLVNTPEGHSINGWDINVAGVRTTSVKRTVRYHQHAVRNFVPMRDIQLNSGRNSSCVSSRPEKGMYLLVEGTVNLQGYTRGCEQSYPARCLPHCRAKIGPLQKCLC